MDHSEHRLPKTQPISLEKQNIETAQTENFCSKDITPYCDTIIDQKLKEPLTGMEINSPIPKSLAGYQIISRIGEGGMGTVFLAEHTGLRKKVALKIISNTVLNKDTISRFIREARTLAQLEHPNIVQVHDVGSEDGQYYLVMQYIEGTTLQQKILQEKLSYSEKLNILLQVSEAIAFAHERQIIHRDIKADNVLISRSGEVKLADFGLAKLFNNDSTEAQLTVSGQILGTPDYLAPEISLGKPANTLSDLYALGVLFYFTLTKKLPFKAENLANLLLKHVHEIPVSPQTYAPEISEDLNYLILKMLQKFPEERYASVEAMQLDFQQIIAGEMLLGQNKKIIWEARNRVPQKKKAFFLKFRFFFVLGGILFLLIGIWWMFALPIVPNLRLEKQEKQKEFIENTSIFETSLELLTQQIKEQDDELQQALIQVLKKELFSFSTEKKLFWIRVLGHLQKKAEPCVPEIARCLSDKEQNIAEFSAEALSLIGTEEAITHLIPQHQHSFGYIRKTSAWAAGKQKQKRSLEILKTLLKDPLDDIQFQAILSLGELGVFATETKPLLLEKLKTTTDLKLLQALSLALLKIGVSSNEPLEPFLEALQYSDDILQGNLIFAIGLLGPRAKKAISQIKPFLKSQNNHLYINAKTALIKIGDPETITISSLIQDLESSSPEIQETAAERLGQYGKEAKPAISALEKLLKDKNIRVRYFASQALQKIQE